MDANRDRAKKLTGQIWILLGVLLISFSLSGCEPLRKKFTRKKKEDPSRQIEPILDPIEYPAAVKTPAGTFRYHYSMFKVWQRDLLMSLEEVDSDKRILHLFDQALAQMDEMNKYVSTEKQALISEYRERWIKARTAMTRPAPMRKYGAMYNHVDRIGRDVRRNFKKMDEKTDFVQ